MSVMVGVMAVFAVVLSACNPEKIQTDLDATYNARQCIMDHESRHAGMYRAENSSSSASGAYQWLDGSWATYLSWAETAYGLRLTTSTEDAHGARRHASAASAYTQDVVSALAFVYKPQNVRPWPYRECWALVGSGIKLRPDGPVSPVPLFIQKQIDAYLAQKK